MAHERCVFFRRDVMCCDRCDTQASSSRSLRRSVYYRVSGIGWVLVGEMGVVVCGGVVFDDGLCHGALHDG